VKIQLITGETEYLITNLNKKEFKYKDIIEIYRLRMGNRNLNQNLKKPLKN
jgi:hypothetical protein